MRRPSRAPLLQASEAEVQAGYDILKSSNLVVETSGERVARYAHNLERARQVAPQAAALRTSLMLRGPQTAGELRISCERLHSFSDISAVQGFLDELAARPAGALVVELPRLPGARENRWAHLLSGTPKQEAPMAERGADAGSRGDVSLGEVAALKANVARLEAEVRALKALVASICAELGIGK